MFLAAYACGVQDGLCQSLLKTCHVLTQVCGRGNVTRGYCNKVQEHLQYSGSGIVRSQLMFQTGRVPSRSLKTISQARAMLSTIYHEPVNFFHKFHDNEVENLTGGWGRGWGGDLLQGLSGAKWYLWVMLKKSHTLGPLIGKP